MFCSFFIPLYWDLPSLVSLILIGTIDSINDVFIPALVSWNMYSNICFRRYVGSRSRSWWYYVLHLLMEDLSVTVVSVILSVFLMKKSLNFLLKLMVDCQIDLLPLSFQWLCFASVSSSVRQGAFSLTTAFFFCKALKLESYDVDKIIAVIVYPRWNLAEKHYEASRKWSPLYCSVASNIPVSPWYQDGYHIGYLQHERGRDWQLEECHK